MHIVFPSNILYIQEMKFDEGDSVNFFYAKQKIIRIFLKKFYGLMNVHLQIMECSIGVTNIHGLQKIHDFEEIRIIKCVSVLTFNV